MHHLFHLPREEEQRFRADIRWLSSPGKVFRVVELNHMLHRLCGPPSIPLSFSLATVVPRRGTYRVNFGTESVEYPLHLVPNVYSQDYRGL